jgi:hypothetical protein
MNIWKIADLLGFNYADFNDWIDQATKDKGIEKHFQHYAEKHLAAKAAWKGFWKWATKNTHQGIPKPGFESQMQAWDQKLTQGDIEAVQALADLLQAYLAFRKQGKASNAR